MGDSRKPLNFTDEDYDNASKRPLIHPILRLNHTRASIWKHEATDEDFMQYINLLSNIYAGRKRKQEYSKTEGYEPLDTLRMLKDYKKWLEENGQA